MMIFQALFVAFALISGPIALYLGFKEMAETDSVTMPPQCSTLAA